MIKFVAPAQHHPANRPLADFHRYWAESHGPLFANTARLRRYVQHLTLPDAYGGAPAPTFDGVSMFWYDEFEPRPAEVPDQEMADLIRAVRGVAPAVASGPPGREDAQSALLRAVLKDDSQLFDRSLEWPMHHKRAAVAAREVVIVEGATTAAMVKAIFIVSKLPGLTLGEFLDRWQRDHGRLAAAAPGLRRYVQNHAIAQAYAGLDQTHDGWSELWFDDLGALRHAVGSPEWDAVREHGRMLFAAPVGVGVARERVQKEIGWTYRDWGVGAIDADAIRRRLRDQGYDALAAADATPARLKRAAAHEALAVWTDEHLVTIDAAGLDARPERRR
jgi:uncharacterized protein (TIGR02118 family)